MYVSENKKITATTDKNLQDGFMNRFNELLCRGYTIEEASGAISDIIKERGIIDDQLKAVGVDPKWKKFEKIVTGIHMLQCQGAKVKFNDHIFGKMTRSERQVDVSVRIENGFYEYLTIIECKDTGRNVSIKEVSDLSIKMEDVGAQRGVMVASAGFQSGAIELAQSKSIATFTLKEIKSDWTKQIKENAFVLPFPEHIELDHPPLEECLIGGQGIPITYDQVVFHSTPEEPPIQLTNIIRDMANHIVENKLGLPIQTTVTFDPYVLYQLPTTATFAPLYGVTILFVPSEFAFRYSIDIPPKIQTYRYSDLKKQQVHDFNPKDIPEVD